MEELIGAIHLVLLEKFGSVATTIGNPEVLGVCSIVTLWADKMIFTVAMYDDGTVFVTRYLMQSRERQLRLDIADPEFMQKMCAEIGRFFTHAGT